MHRPRVPALLGAAWAATVASLSISASASPFDGGAFAASVARGPVYAGLTALIGGLLVCLTPCVYPMIAITVSVFGARETKSRWQAMALSTAFVTGIIAMFTPLGVAAGMTGSLFGAVLSNRWIVASVALVFAALAASMLGAFELVLPSGLSNRLARVGGGGYLGAFLLGMVSGIIAAPCTGPVLGGILLWIGETRSAWMGGGAMLAFSIGLGLPFWLVGTFAIRLPKSGPWMVGIKTFFGIVLAAAALYFLRTAVPALGRMPRPGTTFMVTALGVALAGTTIAMLAPAYAGPRAVARKLGGSLAGALGLFAAFASWQMAPVTPRTAIEWRPFQPEAIERARAFQRPVLIDFTAEWCGACMELAKHTFADGAIVAEAERFECLRVDATDDADPLVGEAQKRFRVAGLPTVLFIDRDGREQARLTEFVPPTDFLRLLQSTR